MIVIPTVMVPTYQLHVQVFEMEQNQRSTEICLDRRTMVEKMKQFP